MSIICYIGLGSNLASPYQQLLQAISALRQLENSELLAHSPFYSSEAVGPGEQADYVNAAVKLATNTSALKLLAQLQEIEQRQGRERSIHWGPRTLDLDLLLYGNQTIDLPELQVPHPRLLERNFVVLPLWDIAPGLVLPNGHKLDAAAYSGLSKLQVMPDTR